MPKLLSLFAGAAMLGLVGFAAQAAEPVTLTDKQMDTITAGIQANANVQALNLLATVNNMQNNQQVCFLLLAC